MNKIWSYKSLRKSQHHEFYLCRHPDNLLHAMLGRRVVDELALLGEDAVEDEHQRARQN